LIDYSRTARRRIRELIALYKKKHRPEAIRNLRAALVRAEGQIAKGSAYHRPFPATHRTLARPNRAWLKVAIYWIAYELTVAPAIIVVFWEGANLGQRYPDVP